MLKNLLIVAIAALFLLTTGYLHGRLTNRWGYAASLQASLDKLDQLPLFLGDWEGTIIRKEVGPDSTRFSGSFVRATYVNRQNGDAVNISLICGRAGPLSLHPPTICFPAHGYTQKGPPVKTSIELKDGKVEFLCTDYTRARPTGEEQIHILWCYGFDGNLAVPENPRVSLASRPAVYKLYASRAGLADRYTTEKDPVQPFLRALLPELKQVLFGS